MLKEKIEFMEKIEVVFRVYTHFGIFFGKRESKNLLFEEIQKSSIYLKDVCRMDIEKIDNKVMARWNKIPHSIQLSCGMIIEPVEEGSSEYKSYQQAISNI